IRDEFGVLKGHKQDGSGQTVLTTLKEALLEQIAKEGGGESFVATVGGDEVDRFVKSIDRLGRAVFEKKQASDYAEYYQFPLLISLFCFFLFVFVSRRRKAPRVWKGRFELASVVLVFGFCLSSYAQSEPDGKEKPNPYREKCLIDPKLSVGEDVQGLGVSAVFKTKDAIASFSDKKFSESLMKFTELSVENPDIPLLTFNLASGFVGAEQVDQAVKEYERLFTTAQTQDLKYLAAFNLGVLEAARMSPERPSAETSLKWYQKALEFRPDSIETKNNIELLIQQQ
ncbi:MAG: hypothetical protein KDD25_08590, partial [Bdellovibrionales bacterium]|nr:hypothetical protein [Bdellovibrionales bacterium]